MKITHPAYDKLRSVNMFHRLVVTTS